MRVIFMGSPDFAVSALQAIHAAGHEIVCVYSQPPRPQGRGQKLTPTAVHQAAETLGLMVRTPASLKPIEEVEAFEALQADVAIVAAYGLILRQNILDAPKHGCINIHGSLLPRWRGAAPVQRAIQQGDAETGVTIMQMDIGLDTGPMLFMEKFPIINTDTTQTVMDKMAQLGGAMIVHTLAALQENELSPQPQPAEGIEYAHKIAKSESIIEWSQSAHVIEQTFRAFTPWPGLWFSVNGERLRIIATNVAATHSAQPGTVIANDPLTIACGDGSLQITHIQRAGRAAQDINKFLRGFPIIVGTVCDIVAGRLMQRWKLTIEYDGRGFFGWQKQPHHISVQQTIEQAFHHFSGETVKVVTAGRTDVGVHARGQVAHADLVKEMTPDRLMLALNALVRPHPVSILQVERVAPDFHARFQAIERRYQYRIINRRPPLAIDKGLAWHVLKRLDVIAMQKAADHLLGKHDFTSFRGMGCQAKHAIRAIDHIGITQQDDIILIDVAARSFLYHQVRNIVGTLVKIGVGSWSSDYMKEILEAKDRTVAGPTAPPDGLYFMQARYLSAE